MPLNRPKTLCVTVSDYYAYDAIGLFIAGIEKKINAEGHCCKIFAERHGEDMLVSGNYADCLNNIRPDDILLHNLSGGEPELPRLLSAPCKKVIFFHNITPPEYFSSIDEFAVEYLKKGISDLPLLRSADALYANSRWTLEDVEKHLAPGTPKGVVPPINPGRLKRLAANAGRMPRPLEQPYIISVGRIVPHKNLEKALELFRELALLMPLTEYVILGNGPENYVNKLKSLAEDSGLLPRVHFVENADNISMGAYLANAGLLLSLSLHEGYCVPLMEAMSCGVPVAIGRQQAMHETAGESGIVLCGDAKHDARTIAGALTDSSVRSNLIKNGNHQYLLHLSSYEKNEFWNDIRP